MSELNPLKILFVDDEPLILDGLRRQFRSKRKVWEVRVAGSADEALALMEQDPASVVVSDMQMPQISGAALLTTVRLRWPHAVRIILSGQTDQAEMLKDIGVIHQFLQKPCPPETIALAVERTTRMSAAVRSGDLDQLVGGLESLPVVSGTYRELIGLLEDEDSDVKAIGAVVEKDIGLSTKLLQMVNSAFFGLPRTIRSAQQAILLIGLQNLKQMALTSQIFDAVTQDQDCDRFVAGLWRVSSDISSMAAGLARANGQPAQVQDTARLAGTLSLIGRAVLARNAPERFARAQKHAASEGVSLREAEIQEFKLAHEAVGAYALGLWAFDHGVVDAVALQASPDRAGDVGAACPLPYLHVARGHVARAGIVEPLAVDRDWVESVGIDTAAATSIQASEAA